MKTHQKSAFKWRVWQCQGCRKVNEFKNWPDIEAGGLPQPDMDWCSICRRMTTWTIHQPTKGEAVQYDLFGGPPKGLRSKLLGPAFGKAVDKGGAGRKES